MLRFLSSAAVALILLPSVSTAQTTLSAVRFAFFSPSRAFAGSPDGKLAQEKLSAIQAERMKEIDARRKTLQTQRLALEQSAAILSDAARRLREQEVERFQIDLDRYIQDAQAEFAGVQRDLESAFLVKLRPAIDRVARDKALLLVFNEDAGFIAWADPSLDVTPDVLKQLAP